MLHTNIWRSNEHVPQYNGNVVPSYFTLQAKEISVRGKVDVKCEENFIGTFKFCYFQIKERG